MLALLSILACTPDYQMIHREYVTNVLAGELDVVTGVVSDPALDVLWVVDTSGSMLPELDRLPAVAAQMALALGGPPFVDLDWRMAAKSAGDTRLIQAWISASDGLDPALSAPALFAGLSQDGGELGISIAIHSLTFDPWWRADAHRLIIWVSDEDTQGGSATASDWASVVPALQEPGYPIQASAVVHLTDGPTGCLEGYEAVGREYMTAADHAVSICDPSDWVGALAPAADVVPNSGSVWRLPHPPLDTVDGIAVYVDGIETDAWAYVDAMQAVVLDEVPPSGSTVAIYYVW